MPMTFSSVTVVGRQIRAAMLGSLTHDIVVVRQARRIHEHDTDELALLCVASRSWWVAQRLGDRLSVCAFAGEDEAWERFDRTIVGASWVEALPAAA